MTQPTETGQVGNAPRNSGNAPGTWAANLLDSDFYVIDVIATGKRPDDEVIEIGIINARGETRLNSRIKPSQPIASETTRLYGISDADVADAPTFANLYPQIVAILEGQVLVAYDLGFVARLLQQTSRRFDLPRLKVKAAHAVKEWYAKFEGERDVCADDFRTHRLDTAASRLNLALDTRRTAIGDCLTTLMLIRTMASE